MPLGYEVTGAFAAQHGHMEVVAALRSAAEAVAIIKGLRGQLAAEKVARHAAEKRAATAEAAIARVKAVVSPEVIDVEKHSTRGTAATDAGGAASAGVNVNKKRKAGMMELVHEARARLVKVKTEKVAADSATSSERQQKQEVTQDLEDQKDTTEMVNLTLDRWQTYADALKMQLRKGGQEPLRWDGRGPVPPLD